MSFSSGKTTANVLNSGVAGSANNGLGVWPPDYYGLKAANGDIGNMGITGGSSNTQTCWATRVYCPTAFTLAKVCYWVNTIINTGTAAKSTTVAAGSNNVDVTTYTAASGSLVVADSSTFNSSGTFILQTNSAPAGYVLCSYTSKADGTHLSGVTTLQGGTGVLATGGTVVQTLNTIMVFNNACTTVLGFLQDQVSNWGTTGLNGAAAAPQSLVIPNGVTPSITAGTYVWVVYLTTWTTTTPVVFRVLQGSGVVANGPITDVSTLRLGKVGTTTAYFPAVAGTATVNTVTPASFTNTNTGSGGMPWFGLL